LTPFQPLTPRDLGDWAAGSLDREGRLEDLFA
jgi:hypothetical protein